MKENDQCEEKMLQSPSNLCGYNLSNGYFGKPTKSRLSQPSMFDILTWNQQTINQGKQNNMRRWCNCNCQCSQDCQRIEKERKNSPANPQSPQYLANKGKQNESRKWQQKGKENIQKAKDEMTHKQTSPKKKNVNELHKSDRPKSAVVRSKSAKIMTTPTKLPKFIGDAIKQQQSVEQEPIETKEKLIEKFKQTTRWIPNSAFTTYFGKPAFENYGRGNTNPAFGGLMYGNYLKTHNIQPHRGVNSPKNIQSYNIALTKGQQAGTIYPYPPKASKKAHAKLIETSQTCGDVQCTKIYAQQNNLRSLPIHPPNLYELQKFGGKGIQKMSRSRLERSSGGQNEGYGEDYDRQSRSNQNAPKRIVY